MEFVKIAKDGIEGYGECAITALPIWEGQGWRRVEPSSDPVDLSEPADPAAPAPEAKSPRASRRAATTSEE